MSTTIEIWHQVDVQGDASVLLGNKNVANLPVIANGQVFHVDQVSVADNYTSLILWAAPAAFPDFTWGIITANKDLLVEMKNSLGTAEYRLDVVKANVPYYFGYNSRGGTTARISTGVQTTGLGNINQINVQNNVAAAQGAATVSLFLFR